MERFTRHVRLLGAISWVLAQGCAFAPAELAQGPGFAFEDPEFHSAADGNAPIIVTTGTCVVGDTVEVSSNSRRQAFVPQNVQVPCSPEGTFEAVLPAGYDSGDVNICVSTLFPAAQSSGDALVETNCRAVAVTGVCDALGNAERTDPSGFIFGAGTRDAPWVICSTEDFRHLARNDSGELWKHHFLLGRDLAFELPSVSPIGSDLKPFTGTFDGYEHRISAITLGLATTSMVAGPLPDGVGLFGTVGDASTEMSDEVVTRLRLIGPLIVPGMANNVGGLIGTLEGGTVRGCTVSRITLGAAGENWGGLVGRMASTRAAVRKSSVYHPSINLWAQPSSNVLAVGGAVGKNEGGTISGVNVGGEIRLGLTALMSGPSTYIGGLVGSNEGLITWSRVKGSCETSSAYEPACIAGDEGVGGLVGENTGRIEFSSVELLPAEESPGAPVDRAWVRAKYSLLGGLVGINHQNSSDSEALAPAVVSSNAYIAHVAAVATDFHGETRGTYVGGLIGKHDTTGSLNLGTIENCYVAAAPERDSPMVIRGAANMGGLVGASTAPIANSSAHVTIDAEGGTDVGGLVGHAHALANITDSQSSGTISSTGEKVGGMVGNLEGSIEACHTTVDVTGTKYVGGLVGYAYNSVTRCSAEGDVIGHDQVGGLVGQLSHQGSGVPGGSVVAGYAHTGEVRGCQDVGGLVGNSTSDTEILRSRAENNIFERTANDCPSGRYHFGGAVGFLNGELHQSLARGDVHAPGSYDVGGLVGEPENTDGTTLEMGYITDCYAEGDVQGNGAAGTLIGETSGFPTVERSFALGELTTNADTSHAGLPLIGFFWPGDGTLPTITDCYFAHDAYSTDDDAYGTYVPIDNSVHTLEDNFPALQSGTWEMRDGDSYPRLKWEP